MKTNPNISKAFIGFVIASAIIWLFINLIKEYTTKLTYVVNFTDLSQEKILKDKEVKELDILVTATGFKLLSANFSSREIDVSLDKLQQKEKNDYYILPNRQYSNIQNQLPSGVALRQIEKDTLFLKVDVLASKKVPLVEDLDITYQVGYDATDKITIEPDSVLISGAQSVINTIDNLRLAKLQLQNISEDIQKEIDIVLPNETELKVSDKTAKITINVDKFTEGEVEVPIEIKNFSNKKELTIFPKTVKVFFKVGLKNYNKITPGSFTVECDYALTKNNGIDYLIPKITTKPKFVSSVRIVPDKIDFLIRK